MRAVLPTRFRLISFNFSIWHKFIFGVCIGQALHGLEIALELELRVPFLIDVPIEGFSP